LQNLGTSAAWVWGNAVTLFESALSQSNDQGFGTAVALAYRGDPFGQATRDGLLSFRIEHRTSNFREASAWSAADQLQWDAAIDYRIGVTDRLGTNVGAFYFRNHDGRTAHNAFAGVTYGWGAITASASLRYANQNDRGRDLGAFFTLSMPIGQRGQGYASYDTIAETTRAEYRRRRSLDYPAVDLAMRALHRRNDTELGGRIGFETSRFDANMDISHYYQGDDNDDHSVGTLRLQSGLAYVDGRIGVGRDPGRGFLMVDRHASLAASPVEIRSSAAGRPLGRADALGPAVLPVLASYRPQEIRINPLDLPPGYDIGPGGYVINPGATSGLSIQIGADAHHIALGWLYTDEGAPIALRTGRLISLATGEIQPFFTNAQGRVSLNRLAAGRYKIEIEGSDWAHEIEIRDQDPALIDLGRITMTVTP
jgi:outer membrane usher protein